MSQSRGTNKVLIARRVIDVLEFFDAEHPQVTVTDLVRRFDWPQSSTSELLCSLVELGFLYKDPRSRTYWPTPRVAMVCNAPQPEIVHNGSVMRLVERLSEQTGLGVGIFGTVGLNVQVYHWRSGKQASPCPVHSKGAGIRGGAQEPLYASAAGLLLLSTIPMSRRESIIRHLNADAPPERKFVPAEISAQVQTCRRQGFVSGSAGFGVVADIVAVLLPGLPESRPLAIGFAYSPTERVDTGALLMTLQASVARLASDIAPDGDHTVAGPARVVRLVAEF